MKTNKINATLIQRSLSQELVDELNSKNDWSETLWGPAYLATGFADAEKGITSSDLYMLFQHGIYQPTGRYKVNAYCTSIDESWNTEDLEAAADMIFCRDNNPTAKDTGAQLVWRKDEAPSMSVGDLVYFELIDVCLVCCNFGWTQLTDTQRDLVNRQTVRSRAKIALEAAAA